MADYQERVVTEAAELDARLAKLAGFIASDSFPTLAAAERDRMRRQSALMTGYLAVLRERIAAFPEQ